ncbi:peptidylprolyl isomerase [Paludicola sp. MB14-C6]|uniref:peptidylprolyl isomerase n=1 Tax=Paludihabitans sp. MB14-C6 TaxID=3070656 RepID=UPI0027DD8DD3|nr:peptidylprolyl isomerase [Paludicola sp. MB14-C6]WMJ22458.1 peptidylprolyl isomerase [Paludicola sp. MB14-C6]
MKKLKVIAVILVIIFVFTGCMPANSTGVKQEDINLIQFQDFKEGQETAVITTSLGTIKMVLFAKEAPKTVAHFKKLVNSGFYNNKTVFIESNAKSFVTGAKDETGVSGELMTDDKKAIQCEVTPNLYHFSGAVSVLAQEKNPFSKKMVSDSRFFIVGDVSASSNVVEQMEKYKYPPKVVDAYKEHGGLFPQFVGLYTVFGQVYEGLEVVNEISKLKCDAKTKLPTEKFVIEKIELSTYQKS